MTRYSVGIEKFECRQQQQQQHARSIKQILFLRGTQETRYNSIGK